MYVLSIVRLMLFCKFVDSLLLKYLTAAGLDSGLIICTIIIFFAITLPEVCIIPVTQ